jgi:Protein of unknown function (DUF3094)
MAERRELSPEDQERVDKFVSEGINSVERKPFRPFRLLMFLAVCVMALTLLSKFLARFAGVY